MKKLIAALALTTAACAVPAFADVGVSIRIGEPGFYGQLDVGDYGRPRLLFSQPMLIEHRYRNLEPVYLRVPPEHARYWGKYCYRYDACARPVYFVRDDWYRDVYAPRYRQIHSRDWRDDRSEHRDDYRDNRHDDHNERRDDRRDDHRDEGHKYPHDERSGYDRQ